MIIRSLVASAFLVGSVAAGNVSAQVLLCPEPPSSLSATADVSAEAERLLKRLTIALDLHGHRGIDEGDIIENHAETPSALLAKLTNVADRCAREANDDPEDFHAALPDLRKVFLDATGAIAASRPADAVDKASAIKTAALESKEAERVERSIDLSIRELWRNLWFRPAQSDGQSDSRWAVIVASPPDTDSGWDTLGEHQREWLDTYFQLHEPYYDSNPHHAIVVGRRLPRSQAVKLRDFVIELGMADDAYIWPLPQDGSVGPTTQIKDQANAGGDSAELDLNTLKE